MPDDSKAPAETETAKAPVDEGTMLMSLFTPDKVEQPSEETTDETLEEPETEEPRQPRRIRVKLQDTEEEVTEEELVKGYQRQSDYSRKAKALADERRKFEAEELVKVREERQRYAAALAELETALKPATPDWEKIQQEAPEQFPALFAKHQIEEKNYLLAQAERQKADLQVQRDRAEQRAKLQLEEKARLLEKMPEFEKPDVRETLGKYLKEQGFTDEEIAGTDRHELFVMARKAQLYDEAMKKKPEIKQKVESKIRPAKPGASASVRPAKTQIERDVKRLEKSGTVEDFAKVFEHML